MIKIVPAGAMAVTSRVDSSVQTFSAA